MADDWEIVGYASLPIGSRNPLPVSSRVTCDSVEISPSDDFRHCFDRTNGANRKRRMFPSHRLLTAAKSREINPGRPFARETFGTEPEFFLSAPTPFRKLTQKRMQGNLSRKLPGVWISKLSASPPHRPTPRQPPPNIYFPRVCLRSLARQHLHNLVF